MKKQLSILVALAVMMAAPAFAAEFKVATGNPKLSYHNAKFVEFKAAIKREAGEDHTVVKAFPKKGTDGSKQNGKLVNAGEKANVGFLQFETETVVEMSNVELFGPIGIEVANLMVKEGGDFTTCSSLESKKAKIGLNTHSGSAVTWQAYGTKDGGYKKATVVDITSVARAKSALRKNEIDAYYWISAPGTAAHKKVLESEGYTFGHCKDGDFKKFEINGTSAFPYVSFSKKEAKALGFGKQAIKTHMVYTYIAVNKDLIAEDESLFELFDSVSMNMYKSAYGKGINNKWYPKK